MPFDLPVKLRGLTPYDPGAIVCDTKLDANESCFNLPADILAKIIDRISAIDFNRYPDPNATALCSTAASYYGVEPDCIIAGNGSDELISIIIAGFSSNNAPILICDPDFSMYRFYAHMCETEVASFDKSEMRIDIDTLIEDYKRIKPSLIIFSNPCNPTGTGILRDDVIRLAKSVDCLLVVDEAYMDFWDQSIITDLPFLDNVIVLRTCSKAMGLAAVRLGFALGKRHLIDALRASKSPFNVNTLTQATGEVYLSEKAWISSCVESIKSSRDSLVNQVEQISAKYPNTIQTFSTKTNFILLKSSLCNRLHNAFVRGGVSVRLLMGDYLRVTAGNPEENSCFLNILDRFLDNEVNLTCRELPK